MYTKQEIVNSLQIDNSTWSKIYNTNNITYSFKYSRLPYEYNEDHIGFSPLSNAARTATMEIFDYISSLVDLNFVYTQDIGNIVLAGKSMNETLYGYAYSPGSKITNDQGGDLYLNSNFTNEDFKVGGSGWSTLVHEIGHTLGLNHPFNDGEAPNINNTNTVMSYNETYGYDTFNKHYYSIQSYIGFTEIDIYTLQSIYGKNTDDSNTTYNMANLLQSNKINGYGGVIEDNIYAIYDFGGNDTIDISNITGNNKQYIDLSLVNKSVIKFNDVYNYVTITEDTKIENIIGSNSDDTIILNNLSNTIDASAGNDSVYIETNDSHRIDVLDNNLTIISSTNGFDKLTSVESIYINNNEINQLNFQRESISSIDHEGASSISRLYLSVFNRLADKDGLEYWVNRTNDKNDSMNLLEIASSFIVSNEFQTSYASDTNEEYINLLYTNILNREADKDGLDYWINDMNNGQEKADLLVSFSQSEEFIELTGIYFQNDLITIL